MAFDGIFLHSLLEELKKEIINAKVDKVNQPEKDEIVLTIRCSRSNKKLLISASSNYPRIQFTNLNKTNPLSAPMYCMVLRKYLTNAKIVDIRQLNTDRVLIIDFESSDELGFNSIYSLVVEIMGKHSNITLVRQRDKLIMDSIKHITPDINTYRCLYPGIEYVSPPPSQKLDPFNFGKEEFMDAFKSGRFNINENIFYNIFTGASKLLSKEISFRLRMTNINIDTDNSEEIYNFTKLFFASIDNNEKVFTTYSDDSGLKDFYCLRLYTLKSYKENIFNYGSEMLESFYCEKDNADRLNSKSSDLQKLINNNLDRCQKKLEILNRTLEECKEKDFYKLQGELLTSYIYEVKQGDKEITVVNYYSEDGDTLTIKLDEYKSPSDNIQYYYRKYNKLKKSEEAAQVQLGSNNKEVEYLQSVLTSIKTSETYDEIEEIRNELVETGYIKFKKEFKKNKLKASKPIHYLSSDGADIYVGKNNVQNDYLTLKFADKHDIWMHTKNIPGSHVIIKNTGKISDKTMEEAATLAAYFSKAKDSSKVPIDYTEVKNVKKPSGSKPGMVIYYTNKTIYVEPCDLNLNRV